MKMMREAKIILPKTGNNGEYFAPIHARFCREVCRMFGGFTAQEVMGGWWDDNGNYYADKSMQYMIAMEPSLENDAKLTELALSYGRMMQQLAVYVVYASGVVTILNVPQLEAPAMALAA